MRSSWSGKGYGWLASIPQWGLVWGKATFQFRTLGICCDPLGRRMWGVGREGGRGEGGGTLFYWKGVVMLYES